LIVYYDSTFDVQSSKTNIKFLNVRNYLYIAGQSY
jgi:hypothetical protein